MDAVIIDAVRTSIGKGKSNGALAGVHPVDLHAHALTSLIDRSGIDPRSIGTPCDGDLKAAARGKAGGAVSPGGGGRERQVRDQTIAP
ncbi:acetyl-CoA acetyltransferase [Nocardia sp. GAS34]